MLVARSRERQAQRPKIKEHLMLQSWAKGMVAEILMDLEIWQVV